MGRAGHLQLFPFVIFELPRPSIIQLYEVVSCTRSWNNCNELHYTPLVLRWFSTSSGRAKHLQLFTVRRSGAGKALDSVQYSTGSVQRLQLVEGMWGKGLTAALF